MSGKSDRLVAQAKKYREPFTATLTASDAMERLASLLEDINALLPLVENKLAAHWTMGGKERFEIVEYYLVGAVTCLEWHARARLKDALTCNPESVSPEDLSSNLAKQTIVDAVKNQIPIQDLIAASLSVSNLETYLSTFERVARSVSVQFSLKNWLAEKVESPVERFPNQTRFKHLEHVFNFRNQLVHEIRYEQVGAWRLRSSHEIKEIIFYVQTALETIQEVERQICHQAPPLFPKSGLSGLYITEREQLHSVITQMENDIRQSIQKQLRTPSESVDLSDEDDSTNVKAWDVETEKWNEFILSESRFLEWVDFLYGNNFVMSDFLIVRLQNLRYEYLKTLQSII